MTGLKKVLALLPGLILVVSPLSANDLVEQEVLLLIDSVAQSGCSFERNGKSYDDVDAADHLALKFKRGSRYASSAENFIDRLASESSMSGKPYYISCPGSSRVTSNSWLHQQLTDLRQDQAD